MQAPISSPLRRLARRMSMHRRTVRLAAFCSVINKVWDLAPPLLIGLAVDIVVEREESMLSDFGIIDPWHQLLFLSMLTLVVWVLESIFEYLYHILWRNLAQTVQHQLRLQTFEHVQRQGLSWFDERQIGDLMAIMNDDINQLERFLDKGASDILQVSTTVIIVSAVFFTISWPVALLAMIPIPIILVGSFRYQKSLEPRYAKVRATAGRMNALLENDLSGMTTIQSFTAEVREAARIKKLSEEYRSANQEAIRLSSAFVPMIRMAILLGFTATLLVGGWLTLEGALAVGAFSVLVFMTQRLLWPLTRLGETFDQYQRAMASTTRILDLLDTPMSIPEGSFTPEQGSVQNSDIVLRGLGFSYPNRDPVFGDLDLTIKAKQTLGVVGSTGAGKTTLVRLLLRFVDPTEGAIEWANEPTDSWTLESLRSNISLVGQQITLFPTSILENIRYGRPEASEEEVWEAAKVAEAFAFIEELPQKWQTQIGEGGHRLSGGQRQRIAIARAIVKQAPLLILDEATSAVDNETEAALQRSIEHISRNCTTLIIAHRLSTIRHAHRIIVIDGGLVAESGTHDELIANKGLYARLWAVQTGVRTDGS
jgi:ATP-binding cassette subfamily B protein